jgi:hypothetical protein
MGAVHFYKIPAPITRYPEGFTAPGYIWKPATNGNPGHNTLVCFADNKEDRDCCCCIS